MKKFNARLAMYAFMGFIALEVCQLVLSTATLYMLGTNAIAAYTVGNNLIHLLNLLISAMIIVALFKPLRALTVAAVAAEGLFSLLFIAVPGEFLKAFSVPADILDMAVYYIRSSGVIMLVFTVACVLYRYIVNDRNIRLYLIILGAAVLLSGLLVWLLIPIFGLGSMGLSAGNLVQPLATVFPLLLMNPGAEMAQGDTVPDRGASASSRPYLDEYKRRMREGK